MEQAYEFSERLLLSLGQAAHHCQASIPALKRWSRDGWLAAFKTPAEHCRKELQELQRSLRQYRLLLGPISALYICILIINEAPSIVKLFADLLTKEEGTGMGLGLAICRRVVQEHHGTSEISSTVGQGATLCLTLPRSNGSNGTYLRERRLSGNLPSVRRSGNL
jgi:hypothetical protein